METNLCQLKDCSNKEDCKDCFRFVGNIDKVFSAEQSLRHGNSDIKICDCIVKCHNSQKYICIELTSGTLNSHEFKRKMKQIENCHSKLKEKCKVDCEMVILYKRNIDLPPSFKHKLMEQAKTKKIKLYKIGDDTKVCQ